MPEKLYGLRFTFERDDKDVGRVFSVRGELMNLVGLMKRQLALFQNQRLPVGGTENILLVRIDKLPKIVRFDFGLKIFIKFEIMDRNDFVDDEKIFQFVLEIFFHKKSIA